MIRFPRGAALGVPTSMLVGTLVAGACAPGARAPDGASVGVAAKSTSPVEVTIEVSEWKFSPNNITVPAGTPVKVRLRNKGVIEHDIHIPDYDFHLHANTGKSETASFTADKVGEFALDCTLPGHKEAGMVGKLIVTK